MCGGAPLDLAVGSGWSAGLMEEGAQPLLSSPHVPLPARPQCRVQQQPHYQRGRAHTCVLFVSITAPWGEKRCLAKEPSCLHPSRKRMLLVPCVVPDPWQWLCSRRLGTCRAGLHLRMGGRPHPPWVPPQGWGPTFPGAGGGVLWSSL